MDRGKGTIQVDETGLSGGVFQYLELDAIELDLENPRIAKWVEMYGDQISPEHMSLALGAGDSRLEEGSTTFFSLRESIRTYGGLIHPIVANRESEDRVVVIGGNTRALIFREFRDQGVEGDWDTIPAMVHSSLSREQIDAIRLQTHLVGPRPWDPYSKAKYLDLLRNSQHLTISQIVDYCGGRKREVQDYLAAYLDMENEYRPLLESDDEFDPTRFSSFVELQRPRVQEALFSQGFTKKDFAEWVKDQLLSPQYRVRDLHRILADEESKKVFLADGAGEAVKVLDAPVVDDAVKDATLKQLALEISQRILKMAYSELLSLRSDVASEENEALCDARDHLTQLCSEIVSDD